MDSWLFLWKSPNRDLATIYKNFFDFLLASNEISKKIYEFSENISNLPLQEIYKNRDTTL